MELELTPEEKKAIAALKRLETSWPKSLWLFSASGSLCVMKKDDTNERRYTLLGGMDALYCVETINIENDGGDW